MAQLLHVLALFTDHRETKSSEASLGRMNSSPCSSYKSKKGKGKENAQSPVTQPLSSRKFQCVPNVHGCKGGSFCVVCIESSPPESSKGILGEPRGTLHLSNSGCWNKPQAEGVSRAFCLVQQYLSSGARA